MSFLAGASADSGDKPAVTGLQVQTAVNTLPVPIVWGTTMLAPNLIDYGDFASQNAKAPGGKAADSSTSKVYSCYVAMALCEGPIDGIDQIWTNQSTDTLSSLNLTLFKGAPGQAPWSFLTAHHPARALNYPNTAYVASPSYQLGSSASLPNHNFEITRTTGFAMPGFTLDVDPSLVAQDMLINPRYGCGFPVASIDQGTWFSSAAASTTGDAAYQTYCRALGIVFSPGLTDQETAQTILQRWLQITNATAVWSGGVLKVIPYGDATVTGNGATFVPNLTPVYDLDDDDFVGDGSEDPVQCSITDVADSYNVQRLEVYDRTNAYRETPIEARSQADIETNGLRIASTITAHEICDAIVVAPLVAQLILKQGLAGRNTYTFKLGWEYCLLEPMDFVTLTDAGLGLFKFPVRIVSVEEDDEGTLTITAQEYVAGSGSAPTYAVQTSAPFTPNQNVAPGSINTPIIFEPSSSLTNGDPEVWMVASGDVNYGSNQVWVSTDGGVNYGQVGTMPSQCRQGVLTAILPAPSGGNPDTASTLAVDLTESAGQLLTASVAAATALPPSTLCYADGELLAYATATLLTTSAYDLTYLERGLYGTAAAAHAAGTQFARLDDSVFKYSLPQSYVGQTLHVKFLAINPLGNSAQTLADATDYTFTPTGVGYTIAPPTSPTLAPVTQAQGSGIAVQGLALTWGASAGPLLGSYAVQWSTDGGVTWPGSGTAPAGATQFIISPVVASTSYIARVAAVSQNGRAVSAWAATGSTASGVSGGLSAIANNTILGNNAGVSASPSAISASAVLDMVGSVQGDILYRGSGGWAVLAPSTAGKLLATGGTGANPSWVSGNAGTVTSVGLSMPSPFTVGSSPVTGAGTLTVTMSSVGTGAIVLQSYVDAAIQGLSIKPTATMATSAALPANSYSNGTSGVGATLTGTATGVLTVDGIAAILGAIVLVKNEAAAANDGLYTVTTAGAVGVAYVLTRHVDMDQSAEFSGGFVAVDAGGTANANSLWLCNPSGAVTVGTTAIPFTQLNGATDLVQGSGITISGNAVSISTSYVGQTSITTLGTIATGTWISARSDAA